MFNIPRKFLKLRYRGIRHALLSTSPLAAAKLIVGAEMTTSRTGANDAQDKSVMFHESEMTSDKQLALARAKRTCLDSLKRARSIECMVFTNMPKGKLHNPTSQRRWLPSCSRQLESRKRFACTF